MAEPSFRCGTVALVGRPNVGKSTLLNAMLDWHLSIVGPKPQTTRHKILGILTQTGGQMLFIDTPGLHRGGGRAMNRQLNRGARDAIAQADVVVHLIEAGRWTGEDELVWQALAGTTHPRLLVLNKIDAKKAKETLLPFIGEINAAHKYDGVYLVSAKRRDGLAELQRGIIGHLPYCPPVHGEDVLSESSERFLAGELVREQLMLRLAQELPYAVTAVVDEFRDGENRTDIEATIWVEREGQKAIVIGAGGAQLKAIGTAARRVMEKVFDRRVHLKLWVKVRENWSDDETALQRFGYVE